MLKQHIVRIHTQSFGTYGALRIHAELAFEGTKVGRNNCHKMRQSLSEVLRLL